MSADRLRRVAADMRAKAEPPWTLVRSLAWHPAVALAMADLLDVVARDIRTSSPAFLEALALCDAWEATT